MFNDFKEMAKQRKVKNEVKHIGTTLNMDEYNSFVEAAKECGCSISKYIRQLHQYVYVQGKRS